MRDFIVAIDFDGTIVEDKFPEIGDPIPGAFETLQRMQDKGIRLVLWTCRKGKYLKDAVGFCSKNGIEFDAVNDNASSGFRPLPKIVADIYIDDRANSFGGHTPSEMSDVWRQISKFL